MRWLRTYIFPNWWLKLAALAISCILWTTYTDEPISEVGFSLPLEFVNIPPTLEISSDVPTTIHVRVRGRSALVRRLTTTDLSVRVATLTCTSIRKWSRRRTARPWRASRLRIFKLCFRRAARHRRRMAISAAVVNFID